MARQPRQPALIQRDCPFCRKPVDPTDPEARHCEIVSWHPSCLDAAVNGGRALNGRALA